MSGKTWTRWDVIKMPCMFCGKPTVGRVNEVMPVCRECWGTANQEPRADS